MVIRLAHMMTRKKSSIGYYSVVVIMSPRKVNVLARSSMDIMQYHIMSL